MKTTFFLRRMESGARWGGRILGAGLALVLLAFALGEGLPAVWRQPLAVQLQFAGMLAMLAGFALGWWREAAGGTLAIAGFALFCAVNVAKNGLMPGRAILVFAIPGLLLLIAWGLGRAGKARGDGRKIDLGGLGRGAQPTK